MSSNIELIESIIKLIVNDNTKTESEKYAKISLLLKKVDGKVTVKIPIPSKEVKATLKAIQYKLADKVEFVFETGYVEKVFTRAINKLEKTALGKEGIFRISGDTNLAKTRVKELLSGSKVDLDDLEGHTLASFIKIFARLAFPSLISLEDLNKFKDGHLSKSEFINKLSPIRKRMLESLIHVANKVAANESENRMNLGNMAKMFAPNLFSPKDPQVELMFISHAISFTQLLLAA